MGFEPLAPNSVNGWPMNKHGQNYKSTYFLGWLPGYANGINRYLTALTAEFEDFDVLSLIPNSRDGSDPAAVVTELSELLGLELDETDKAELENYLVTIRRNNDNEEPAEIENNEALLAVKVRGLLWLLTQHRDYMTY